MPSPQIKSPLNDSILFVCKSSPAEGITHAGRRTKSSRIHLPFRAHKQYGAKREPARLRGSPPPPRWARLCPGWPGPHKAPPPASGREKCSKSSTEVLPAANCRESSKKSAVGRWRDKTGGSWGGSGFPLMLAEEMRCAGGGKAGRGVSSFNLGGGGL